MLNIEPVIHHDDVDDDDHHEEDAYYGERNADGQYHGFGMLKKYVPHKPADLNRYNRERTVHIYVGLFHNGEYHGRGTLKICAVTWSLESSDIFIGEWVNGKLFYGFSRDAYKNIYIGGLSNMDRDRGQGDWLRPHGQGRMTRHEDQSYFEGQWLYGNQLQGYIVSANGVREWYDDN